MSRGVSILRDPRLFSPKKAGVISPPPGRSRASHASISSIFKVTAGVIFMERRKVA